MLNNHLVNFTLPCSAAFSIFLLVHFSVIIPISLFCLPTDLIQPIQPNTQPNQAQIAVSQTVAPLSCVALVPICVQAAPVIQPFNAPIPNPHSLVAACQNNAFVPTQAIHHIGAVKAAVQANCHTHLPNLPIQLSCCSCDIMFPAATLYLGSCLAICSDC